MGGHIEEHHRVWLSVTLNKQWTHLVPACLLLWESLCQGNFVVLQVLGTSHLSPHRTCSLKLHEVNVPCNILRCLDSANVLWVPSIHRIGPHGSAHMVARVAATPSRLAHWTSIPSVHVMSTSYAFFSFSITILVMFCSHLFLFSVTHFSLCHCVMLHWILC